MKHISNEINCKINKHKLVNLKVKFIPRISKVPFFAACMATES